MSERMNEEDLSDFVNGASAQKNSPEKSMLEPRICEPWFWAAAARAGGGRPPRQGAPRGGARR